MLNVSTLVAGGAKIVIRLSGIEQGRGSDCSRNFSSMKSGTISPPSGPAIVGAMRWIRFGNVTAFMEVQRSLLNLVLRRRVITKWPAVPWHQPETP